MCLLTMLLLDFVTTRSFFSKYPKLQYIGTSVWLVEGCKLTYITGFCLLFCIINAKDALFQGNIFIGLWSRILHHEGVPGPGGYGPGGI